VCQQQPKAEAISSANLRLAMQDREAQLPPRVSGGQFWIGVEAWGPPLGNERPAEASVAGAAIGRIVRKITSLHRPMAGQPGAIPEYLVSRGVNLWKVAIAQRREGWLRGKHRRTIDDKIDCRHRIDVPGWRPSVEATAPLKPIVILAERDKRTVGQGRDRSTQARGSARGIE
jgi:hypothetical protein